jgi:hypothetical protein
MKMTLDLKNAFSFYRGAVIEKKVLYRIYSCISGMLTLFSLVVFVLIELNDGLSRVAPDTFNPIPWWYHLYALIIAVIFFFSFFIYEKKREDLS